MSEKILLLVTKADKTGAVTSDPAILEPGDVVQSVPQGDRTYIELGDGRVCLAVASNSIGHHGIRFTPLEQPTSVGAECGHGDESVAVYVMCKNKESAEVLARRAIEVVELHGGDPLAFLDDEQRLALLRKYCVFCGGKNLPCNCMRDE